MDTCQQVRNRFSLRIEYVGVDVVYEQMSTLTYRLWPE